MTATKEQIYKALQAADAAGNIEDARQLAQMYASAQAAEAKPAPNIPSPQPSFLDRHGRTLATTTGSILGGLLAAPAALASAPSVAGPLAIEATGVGIGGATAGAAYDSLMRMLNKAPARTPGQVIAQNLKDVAYNAATVPAAGLVVKAAQTVAPPIMRAGTTVGKKVAEAIQASPQAKATAEQASQAVNNLRAQMLQRLGTEQRVAAGGARVAGQQSGWKTAEAEANQRLQEAALKAQVEAQAKAAAAKPLGAGKIATGSETGAQTRAAIVAQRNATQAAFKKVDDELRPIVNAEIAAKEAQGLSVADTPLGKELLKKSKQTMEPDVVTRPGVSSIPKPNTGGSVHSMIIDALEQQRVPLTEAQAQAAKAAGNEVKSIVTMDANGMPTQQFYRTFKTSYEALDNLGRYIGEQAFGKGEAAGFPAVSKEVLRGKYAEIQKALNEFAGPNRVKLQNNWEAKLAADQPVKATEVGKKAVEPVKKTEIPKASEEAVANAAYGSVQGYRNAKQLAGAATAKQGLVNRLETLFRDPATNAPLSYDETARLLAANNGRLQGIVNEEPEVKAMVDTHLRQLHDAKMAGVRATDFGEQAKKYGAAAKEAQTAAGARLESKKAFEAERRSFAAEFSNLRALPEDRVVEKARGLAQRMAESGNITNAQHEQFLTQIKQVENQMAVAKTAAEKKAAVDKLLKWAGGGLVGATVFGAGSKVAGALH